MTPAWLAGCVQEALELSEEAKRAGLAFDTYTHKALAQGTGKVLLSIAEAVRRRPDRPAGRQAGRQTRRSHQASTHLQLGLHHQSSRIWHHHC